MPTVGVDCSVVIDSVGYFVKPISYKMQQQRIRHVSYRADGSLAYVDLGPGKRVWSMTILARNELLRYDGAPTGLTGQQYRDALRASYTGHIGTTITFIDPLGASIAAHFDNYIENVIDLKSQIIGPGSGGSAGVSYEIHIELMEA